MGGSEYYVRDDLVCLIDVDRRGDELSRKEGMIAAGASEAPQLRWRSSGARLRRGEIVGESFDNDWW
jgi:hypothetical protein